MKKHPDQEICPVCDSQHIEVRYDRKVHYLYLKKDHVLEGQEHTICLECGLSFYQPGQVDRNKERFAAFEKSLVKGISPNEIRALREEYLITQEQAARIFNCGKTAFSKWERGEVAPTGPTALLLKEALKNPVFMQKLADNAGESINIQKIPPKHEEQEIDIQTIVKFIAANPVNELVIKDDAMVNNVRFSKRINQFNKIGHEYQAGYTVCVDSKGQDDNVINLQKKIPAWMSSNFR